MGQLGNNANVITIIPNSKGYRDKFLKPQELPVAADDHAPAINKAPQLVSAKKLRVILNLRHRNTITLLANKGILVRGPRDRLFDLDQSLERFRLYVRGPK
jgi:hypothetical protein